MRDINNISVEKGYVEAFVSPFTDLLEDIEIIKKRKNALILAHYYQNWAIQQAADFIGDSLALAQKAVSIDADIIIMCGVHFMGETVKILNMNKKVLVPDLNAGCSLAQSCKEEDLKKFKSEHPDYKIISYVNTTAEVKAISDIVVTSGNAVKIVNSLPKEEKILFGPDRNLGRFINEKTGRKMLLWDGACHVHERFKIDDILALKERHPDALILSHPECKKSIVDISDFTGSTAEMIKFVSNSSAESFIIVTEEGIMNELRRNFSDKIFIPAPSEFLSSHDYFCNECEYMRLNTLEKLYLTLKYELPEITVEPELAAKAKKSIDTMLSLS